jgi:hypothetical protein
MLLQVLHPKQAIVIQFRTTLKGSNIGNPRLQPWERKEEEGSPPVIKIVRSKMKNVAKGKVNGEE